MMNIMHMPLVSICVPTWNSALYLRESLDSILAQDYPDFEVIVSDNASQDDTLAILEEYEQEGRIRLHRNQQNIGAGANFNLLVRLARGEFVAIYHSDDIYDPDIVSASVAFLQSHPETGLVGTMARVISSDGAFRYDYRLPEPLARLGRTTFNRDESILGTTLLSGNRIFLVTPSVMVRRAAYDEFGGFDQATYAAAVDYEMWLRIAARYKIGVIDRPLMKYRIHDKQGSQHEVRTNIRVPDSARLIEAYRSKITDPAVARACSRYLERTLFKTALKQNDAGCFEQSSETIASLQNILYRPAALLLVLANRIGIRLGIRPGGRHGI